MPDTSVQWQSATASKLARTAIIAKPIENLFFRIISTLPCFNVYENIEIMRPGAFVVSQWHENFFPLHVDIRVGEVSAPSAKDRRGKVFGQSRNCGVDKCCSVYR